MTGSPPPPAEGRPLRVLYFIPGNVFGGAHNQVLQLSRSLVERGYESVALLPDEPGGASDRLRDAGVEVHQRRLTRIRAVRSPVELARRGIGILRQAAELERFLRDHRIDLVQVHGLLALDGARAARRAGLPVVWQLIDTRPPPALRRVLTPVVDRLSDVVMTTGTGLLRHYPRVDSDPRRYVPFFPPVDGDRFPAHRDRTAREATRRRLLGPDADPGALVVGSLGNLNPQKGHEHLIEAVASLRARGRRVALLVRGAPSPGHPEYHDALLTLVERHGLPGSTVGSLPPDVTVPEYMSALDVFALTPVRRSEGVPTVLLEAMWAGLPCVTADVGAVRDAVPPAVGAICEPESPESAAAALLELLDADPAARQHMGERARHLAETRFTLEACTAAHVTAYDRARTNHASRQH